MSCPRSVFFFEGFYFNILPCQIKQNVKKISDFLQQFLSLLFIRRMKLETLQMNCKLAVFLADIDEWNPWAKYYFNFFTFSFIFAGLGVGVTSNVWMLSNVRMLSKVIFSVLCNITCNTSRCNCKTQCQRLLWCVYMLRALAGEALI